jgi:uncharacterized protein YegP (UPF0339 family)
VKLVVFKRRLGWYWRLVAANIAANNRTIAIGGEPYASKGNAHRAFCAMWRKLEKTESLKLVTEGGRS